MTDTTGSVDAGNPEGATPSGTESLTSIEFPENWKEGIPEEVRASAALERIKTVPDLAQSYVNAQRLVGMDKLPIPKEGDTDAFNTVYDRLGRPSDPTGYEISVPEGMERDEAFEAGAREAFHAAGLNPSQVQAITGFWHDYVASQAEAGSAATEAAVAADKDALKKEWGPAYDKNLAIAQKAAQAFGDEEAMAALEGQVGYSGIMKMFQKIGEGMGEDSFEGEGGNDDFAITPAQAKTQWGDLQLDVNFMAALLDNKHVGHKEAVQRKARLDAIIAGAA